jgi:hypothetical protein
MNCAQSYIPALSQTNNQKRKELRRPHAQAIITTKLHGSCGAMARTRSKLNEQRYELLDLELIQSQMTQKLMLRGKVRARALHNPEERGEGRRVVHTSEHAATWWACALA